MSLDCSNAISEPQHGRENLRTFREHGSTWIVCDRCGRQWAIYQWSTEVVSEGDGHCDEKPEE